MLKVNVILEKYLQSFFRILLFISSYIPLFVILFLKNIDSFMLGLIFFMVAVIPILIVKRYIDLPLKKEPNDSITIANVSHKGSEILNYVVAYIIPFISFNSEVIKQEGIDVPSLISVMILFLVIGNLYMASNLYYVNPIITLFYDIHSIQDKNGEQSILIIEKNEAVPKDKTILTRRISPKVYLYTSNRANKLTGFKILLYVIAMIGLFILWNDDLKNTIISLYENIVNILSTLS